MLQVVNLELYKLNVKTSWASKKYKEICILDKKPVCCRNKIWSNRFAE